MTSRSVRARRRYFWPSLKGPARYQQPMRILIFHGYLLPGTGSNVYNASLARALAGLGHEVHLLCQDRAADRVDWVSDEAGPGKVKVYNPDIGRVLPVYVADEYEGFDAVTYDKLTDDQLDHYLQANVRAVRNVAADAEPDVALANHLVMGPAIVARALGGQVPYAVKVHGSALEYTVRPDRERFLPYAREGLEQAGGVLVGSRHTAESLWEVLDVDDLPAKTRLGPPGVDTKAFRPRPMEEAAEALESLAGRLEGTEAASWGGDTRAAAALHRLDPREDRIVSYVGKLIVSKGVDLLLAAWPLVHRRVPEAELIVVGFGEYRRGLERLRGALQEGDLGDAREVARLGRELEGGPAAELPYLTSFLADPPEGYSDAAAAAMERVAFTGRLEHEDLPDLLCACQAQVVPSTFPEAFGMVAAEAAACGALPGAWGVVAAGGAAGGARPAAATPSGRAGGARPCARERDEPVRRLLTFDRGPDAVEQIAERLVSWLELDPAERDRATG